MSALFTDRFNRAAGSCSQENMRAKRTQYFSPELQHEGKRRLNDELGAKVRQSSWNRRSMKPINYISDFALVLPEYANMVSTNMTIMNY